MAVSREQVGEGRAVALRKEISKTIVEELRNEDFKPLRVLIRHQTNDALDRALGVLNELHPSSANGIIPSPGMFGFMKNFVNVTLLSMDAQDLPALKEAVDQITEKEKRLRLVNELTGPVAALYISSSEMFGELLRKVAPGSEMPIPLREELKILTEERPGEETRIKEATRRQLEELTVQELEYMKRLCELSMAKASPLAK